MFNLREILHGKLSWIIMIIFLYLDIVSMSIDESIRIDGVEKRGLWPILIDIVIMRIKIYFILHFLLQICQRVVDLVWKELSLLISINLFLIQR